MIFYQPSKKPDFPLYPLIEKKTSLNKKSCFVDSNRVDTVQPAILDYMEDDEENADNK